MSTQTSSSHTLPAFIADPGFVRREPGGRTIKWAAVSDTFIVEATGKKRLPPGKIMSELADGQIIEYGGTDATVSPDETPTAAIGLLATEANEEGAAEGISGYGLITAGVVWENLLPDATAGDLSNGEKSALASGGASFQYRDYSDDRAD